MPSTFAGIELGKRSLMAHGQSIHTAGHNVSNADTEGYSRQRVNVRAAAPLDRPDLSRAETPGQLGQGVSIESVARLRDELLDARITEQSSGESYWATREKYYAMLEKIFNEPDDVSVRTNMDKFWQSWEELAAFPDSIAAREAVVTRGESLVNAARQENKALTGIRDMLNGDIEASVAQVNDYARQIAAVNGEIVRSKALGDNPNDLLDRRDLLVEKLSALINVTSSARDSDEFMLHTDGRVLVQGGAARAFEVVPLTEDNGYSRVIWSDTGVGASFSAGSLGALVELRDADVRRELQNLNTLSLNFMDLVNTIHREGTGANGVTGLDFFTEEPAAANALGSYDRDRDGADDSTYLFKITGAYALDPRAQSGLEGVITINAPGGAVGVPYYGADTVAAVIERINNSGGEVKAYLDREGRLALKASASAGPEEPDFVIRHVEDSGLFLQMAGVLRGSGAEAAYDFARPDAVTQLAGFAADGAAAGGARADYSIAPTLNPSEYMRINPALTRDVLSVAAAYRGPDGFAETGDGRAALDIASVRNSPVMIGRMRSFDDYFAERVTGAGLRAEQAENQLLSQRAIMDDLRAARDAVSGVNVDEELADIIKFQHGYNAAAKYITVVDELLDTIINRLKV